MVNKEIILKSDGTVLQDFKDRNIPKGSHNQVSVECLIPSSLFSDTSLNYVVKLGLTDADDVALNDLYLFGGKTININGVDYTKYSAKLPKTHTSKLGRLSMSANIITLLEVDGTTTTETIKTWTNFYLNVLKAINAENETTVDVDEADALQALINGKKIITVDLSSYSTTALRAGKVLTDYAPSSYSGYIIIAKTNNGSQELHIPCIVNSESTDLIIDATVGKMYKYADSVIVETTLHNHDSDYVKKAFTIAGIDMQDNISASEMKTALNLVEKSRTIAGISLTDNITVASLKTVLGIDDINALLGASADDGDTLVENLKEVLKIFETFPAGTDIFTLLNAKVAKTTTIADIDLANNITKSELKVALDIDDAEADIDTLQATTGNLNELLESALLNSEFTEVDGVIVFNPSNYYNKADVNTALALKANANNVYSKNEIDTSLALKANSADVNASLALKTDTSAMNTALALKANSADVDTALNLKANVADVNTALALKANVGAMNTALNGKLNKPTIIEVSSTGVSCSILYPSGLYYVEIKDGPVNLLYTLIIYIDIFRDAVYKYGDGYNLEYAEGEGLMIGTGSSTHVIENVVLLAAL